MTDREILTEAIQKAIDGGWNCKPYEARFLALDALNEDEGQTVEKIIFNHDFAKALWDKPFPGTNIPATYEINHDSIPAWQYHLQWMVITGDPIKYLGEHLG